MVAFSWTGAALAQGAICEIVPAIEKKILSEMEEWGITGVSVAVVQDQRLVYSKGFGGDASGFCLPRWEYF